MYIHTVCYVAQNTEDCKLLITHSLSNSARFSKKLSNRSSLKGITFLSLFIYKYIADTAFIFISCNETEFGLVSSREMALAVAGSSAGWAESLTHRARQSTLCSREGFTS